MQGQQVILHIEEGRAPVQEILRLRADGPCFVAGWLRGSGLPVVFGW